MSLTIVGGIALDTISIAGGEPHDVLGGSAIYASLAASLFGEVTVVGVVGDDCDIKGMLGVLATRPSITLDIVPVPGKTSRFSFDYDRGFNRRTTLSFSPGVAASFRMSARSVAATDVLFLASGPPEVQLAVLDATRPRLSAVDTIDHWIETDKAGLERVVSKASVVLMNTSEILAFTGQDLISDAVTSVLRRGPRLVCLKQGEFGAQLFADEFHLAQPAFRTRTMDPTGAGDAFAGAFLSYLAKGGSDIEDPGAVGEALVLATAVSSICVEDFGTGALASATLIEVSRRCRVLLDTACVRMPDL